MEEGKRWLKQDQDYKKKRKEKEARCMIKDGHVNRSEKQTSKTSKFHIIEQITHMETHWFRHHQFHLIHLEQVQMFYQRHNIPSTETDFVAFKKQKRRTILFT